MNRIKGASLAFLLCILLLTSVMTLPSSTQGDTWAEQESNMVSEEGSQPLVVVDSDMNTHAAWVEGDDIMFRSKSGGEWGDKVKVSDSDIGSIDPSMAIDGDGNVHISWTEWSFDPWTREVVQRSMIDGEWGSIDVLSPNKNVFSGLSAIAASKDGTLHVVWADGGNPNTELLYRSNTGGSWNPIEKVRPDGDGHPSWPSIAAGPGRSVHVAWYDTMEFQGADDDWGDIFYRSKSQGVWGNTELVSAGSDGTSIEASVAVDDDGVVHVAWKDFMSFPGSNPGDDIYHRAKTSAGWQDVMLVSSGSDGDSQNPSLTVFPDGGAHIVWRESAAHIEIGYSQIVHSNMSDNGWQPFTVVSTETNMSSEPTVANDGLVHAHVVWVDFGDHPELGPGSYIYHKKLWVSDKALIEGVIYDRDGNPVADVEIWASNPGLMAITDEDGRYAFTIEEGDYVLEAKKEGFKTQTISVSAKKGTPVIVEDISFEPEDDASNALLIGAGAVAALAIIAAAFFLLRRG